MLRTSVLLVLLAGCSESGTVLPPGDAGVPPPPPPIECSCEGAPLPPNVARVEPEIRDSQCTCRIVECVAGYVLIAGACLYDHGPCLEGQRSEGWSQCEYAEDVSCLDAPRAPYCHPPSTSPPPDEGCVEGCHRAIEDAHPWFGGPSLSCTACHGGDPSATTREEAHVPPPPELSPFHERTLAGVERFAGGLEWLRFRNPGDLRIADQTCGRSGCHTDTVENVRRSIMATAAGLIDGALAASGVPRAIARDGDDVYKWDATRGMTLGHASLDARIRRPELAGAVERIERFAPIDRENRGYDQIDLLFDLYDKACGGCHLGNAGRNARYGEFRGSGCSACHVVYPLDGRSRSADEMIKKGEPSYPAAYAQILDDERPHPSTHRIVRQVASRRCGTCHFGSNHTELQYRGQQIDPNRTASASLEPDKVRFTDALDNETDPLARYQGLAQDQILAYVDWDDDGRSDIPADIHFLAGLECIDCHTAGEMHGALRRVKVPRVSDWSDPAQVEDLSGAIWSRMDRATEVECIHCHGNLEHRALPSAADDRNPIVSLIVCPELREVIPDYTPPEECNQLGRGRWLRGKFSNWHYVPQTFDTATANSSATHPNGSSVFTENASIFHGRSEGFSHLGREAADPFDQMAGGLECYACHATWVNACFGCHLRLSDSEGGAILRDYSLSTGELTMGKVTEASVSAISPLDMQYGINAEGKIAQLIPEAKQRVAHTDRAGNEAFGTQWIVNGNASLHYNVYRHRSGYGLRRIATEDVGLPVDADGPRFDQDPRMDANAGQGAQPMMPHSVQRSHPRMDCTNCHLDRERTNEAAIAARFMFNPSGFADVSAYLERAQTIFDASLGYRFTTPVIQQADWCVDRDTGFPYCASNHPAIAPFLPEYGRAHPGTLTLDVETAGPLNLELIQKLLTIEVMDRGVVFRGPR